MAAQLAGLVPHGTPICPRHDVASRMRVITRRGPFHFYGWSALALEAGSCLRRAAVGVIVGAVRRPWTALTVALLAGAGWAVLEHPLPTGIAVVGIAEAGHGWALLAPASWRRHAVPWFRARWRWLAVYRREWQPAMTLAGLDAPGPDGGRVLPRLGRVRCRGEVDVVRVRAVLGQRPEQWREAAPMLAHIFRAASCRVRKGDDRRLTLEFVQPVRRGRSWGDPPAAS
jgi:hypothetical protein